MRTSNPRTPVAKGLIVVGYSSRPTDDAGPVHCGAPGNDSMTLPVSLLHHAEQHPCFTGCYSSEPNVSVCLDPNHPPAAVVSVSCQDCFARLGAPVALLPPGSNSHTLAAALTQHVRTR